jgi:hypothetical protein
MGDLPEGEGPSRQIEVGEDAAAPWDARRRCFVQARVRRETDNSPPRTQFEYHRSASGAMPGTMRNPKDRPCVHSVLGVFQSRKRAIV